MNDTSHLDELHARTKNLLENGMDIHMARGKAWLEQRIKIWNEKHGDNFWILIYGDFKPPAEALHIKELGITIHPERIQGSVVNNSCACVLKATVEVKELSVPCIIDAIRRINIFLGTWTLLTWGNASCRWWSWLTHDSGGGIVEPINPKNLTESVSCISNLPIAIKPKVEAALYWVREPKNLIKESARSDLLRVYVSYWNAFECLVEVVNTISPEKKTSKKEKQEKINDYLRNLAGPPTSEDIINCYRIIDPGFKGKASSALKKCFSIGYETLIEECFNRVDQENRLYQIRNSINHGDVDAENLEEQVRIESRLIRLQLIVWGMFRYIFSVFQPSV